jgi:hypothetical protein
MTLPGVDAQPAPAPEASPPKPPSPKEHFPKNATAEDAFNYLARPGRSFDRYYRRLLDEGLVSREQVLRKLETMHVSGRAVEDVRQDLKQAFADRLVTRMALADDASLGAARKRYPDLPWSTNEPAAIREAQHRELLRVTKDLNGADKGTLAEAWYVKVNKLENAKTQVTITPKQLDELRAQGIEFKNVRRFDLIDGDKIREIKSGVRELTGKERLQFADYVKVADSRQPITIGVGDGQVQRVKEVVYTFTDPRGVKANTKWMAKQLAEHDHLSFEIFNANGERMTIDQRNADFLARGDLKRWLGI